MKQANLSKLIISAVLIAVFFIVMLAFGPSFSAKTNSQPRVGMGDLRRIDARQSIPDSVGRATGRSYVGMGDLQRYDVEGSTHVYTGIGDLHLFEAQQSNSNTGGRVNSHSYVGMGDLRRFEAKLDNISK